MEITKFNQKGLPVRLWETKKFNSAALCLVYRTPLRRDTATKYALLPRVLSTACEAMPSMGEINRCLERFGGAELVGLPIKKGEEQIISFYLTAPKEHTGGLFQLLRDIVYKPLVRENGFMPSYVHNARSAVARELADKINHKRSYASEKTIELMCKDESFGVSSDGYIEDLGDVTREGLYNAYQDLLTEGAPELYIVGDVTQEQAESYINNHFKHMESKPALRPRSKPTAPHEIIYRTEEANTAQSCLGVGIRAGEADYPALLIANEILGGSGSSRLFKKIREEGGMCYYINSRLYRYKSIIEVQAGIEAKNAKGIVEQIQALLETISKKGASKDELRNAKSSLIYSLRAMEDSPRAMTDFMLSQSIAGEEYSNNGLIRAIENVKDIRGVFDSSFIDTVFLLKEGGK